MSFANLTAEAYKTDNIMILYGGDVSYNRIDTARHYINFIKSFKQAFADVNITFSTASDYFEAILSENAEFSVFEGDFLPYISKDFGGRSKSWTGFYSSRPSLKKKISEAQSLVRAAEIATALIFKKQFQAYNTSLALHHDAITGTCRSEVSDDYIQRLNYDIESSESHLRKAYSSIITCPLDPLHLPLPYKAFVIHNPINWQLETLMSIESISPYVGVYDSRGNLITSQSVPFLDKYKVYFKVSAMPLSFFTIFMTNHDSNCTACSSPPQKTKKKAVSNGVYTLEFNEGLLQTIATNTSYFNLSEKIVRYDALGGGPYEFRPMVSNIQNFSQEIGELSQYDVYEGEIVSVVNSKWRYKDHEYYQTIVLPMNSITFELKFKLLASLGDEILLEFARPTQESDWFYTFNSADIQLRKPFSDAQGTSGDNYYPIVGGVFINNSQEFLQFFPKFPLGAGMPHDGSFELHLHRNPENDDDLGLVTPLDDKIPVEHEFLIRIGDLNTSTIWKDYLSHKNSMIIFAVGENEEDIYLDVGNNYERVENWNSNTEYSLTDENKCVYLSSLGVQNEKMYANVLNICSNPERFSLNSTTIIEQVLINEKPLLRSTIDIQTRGEIVFEANSNSGKSMIRYPMKDKTGMVSPFAFIGYEIDHTCAIFYQQNLNRWTIFNSEKEYFILRYADDHQDELVIILYFLILLISCIVMTYILATIKRKPRKIYNKV